MPKQKPNEQVQQIPLSEIRPFKNHPFKVTDDELMQQTIDSIMQVGVLNPAIIRPAPEGGYEMIAGHRRLHAADLAGLKTIPAIVRNLDDDEAVILMVDSNLQRETISPMERAQAYKMKLEALKHQGKRVDLEGKSTSVQVGQKLPGKTSRELVAENSPDSAAQIRRYIRLTELLPEVQKKVDSKEIAFSPAVELSYLTHDEQKQFLDAMDYSQNTPSLSQAQRLKKLSREGKCTKEAMRSIMSEEKKEEQERITLSSDTLRKYFPRSYTPLQIVYLQAKGVATLDDLDAALSSVDGRAKALNESVKAKEGRMKKLQKLIEQGGHYNRFKPVHDELKTLKNGWGKKREKFEREHESDLIIWNAANRYLHANLPEGTRSLDISGWQREYNELKAQTTAEYEELKAARSEVRELQQIRRCIDAAERCEQQEQAPSLKNQIKQNMEL